MSPRYTTSKEPVAAPSHITASNRIGDEKEYLESIAWPDEQEATH